MKSIIYLLLNYINGNIKEDTFCHIARFMLLHIRKIPQLSLEKTAMMTNTSVSTINRFCREIGFANYSSFREIARLQADGLHPMMTHLDEAAMKELTSSLLKVETIDLLYLTRMNELIRKSSRIFLLGYGEFQYPALYYQKQMLALGKLIEVKNCYLDNFDFNKLKDEDLLIIVSMQGEFFKPNLQRIIDLHCQKGLITKIQETAFLKNFDAVILCGDCQPALDKYMLNRVFERLVLAY